MKNFIVSVSDKWDVFKFGAPNRKSRVEKGTTTDISGVIYCMTKSTFSNESEYGLEYYFANVVGKRQNIISILDVLY